MKRFLSILLCIVMVFGLCACAGSPFSPLPPEGDAAAADPTEAPGPAEPEEAATAETEKPEGMIYLYGEYHGDPYTMWLELEAWGRLYEKGVRHLFIEYSYADAQLMNLWDPSKNENMYEVLYPFIPDTEINTEESGSNQDESSGDDEEVTYGLQHYFLKKIKEQYPETVFHGIDIEHYYETLGATYLLYLESIGMRESEEYARASSNYEQGRSVYSHDGGIRENYMAENFIYELERLETQDIMGIFGAAHTQLNANAYGYPDIPNMVTQLSERYGDRIESTRLPRGSDDSINERPDPIGPITVNGKTYETAFVAQREFGSWPMIPYTKVVYWRLKDSWDDFADSPVVGDLYDYFINFSDWDKLVYYSVYIADCIKPDGTVDRMFFRTSHAEQPKGFIPIISVEVG